MNINSWLALIGISIAAFLGCTDLTIVNTALPAIQNSFNCSVNALQWVMNIFLLALTGFMVVIGKLSDLYGRRLFLYSGMLLFAFASLGAALSPSINWLILFRFFQGICVAVLYTIPVAMIPSIFPSSLQAKATGIFISISGLGLAMGPVFGGFIVSMSSWHWIFLINIPIILVSFLFSLKHLPESKSGLRDTKIDWWGFILLVFIIPLFIYTTVQGATWGWTSRLTLSMYALSLLGLILFYQIEQRVRMPIIEFHLFNNRVFIIGIIANFTLALFYSVDFFFMPLYLHYVKNLNGYQLGLTLLPATIMLALLSPLTGKIVETHGPKLLLMTGLLCFIISAILQMQFTAYTSFYFIIFAYILFGIGWACILSPSIIAALSTIPEAQRGVATGTLFTLHNFGGALGLALGVLIYNWRAKIALIQQLASYNFTDTSWITRAVANTDQSIALIQQSTSLKINIVLQLFQQAFLKGYTGALLLLVFVAGVALIIITSGMKVLPQNKDK